MVLFLGFFFILIHSCRTKQIRLCVVCLNMPLESLWLHQSTELTPVLVYSSTCHCRVLPTAIIPQPHNSTTCPFSCQHSFSLKNAVDKTNTFKEDESAIACVAFLKSQSSDEVMRIWGILCYKYTDVYSTCMACL